MGSEDTAKLIANSELVTERFGAWPSFHDAEVRSLELQTNDSTLVLVVYAFAYDGSTANGGYLRQVNRCNVTFRFTGLDNLELFDWNQQNALLGIRIDAADAGRIAVSLWAANGLAGEFTCQQAEVVALQPLD